MKHIFFLFLTFFSQNTYSSWADSTLKTLTLEEKVAQLIMPKVYGYYFSKGTTDYIQMMMNVREKKIGSFAIFQSDLLEVATLLNELQKESKIPLLFASDFENGLAMRIRRGTSFPHLMALGATDDSILAYEYGKIIAEESRSV